MRCAAAAAVGAELADKSVCATKSSLYWLRICVDLCVSVCGVCVLLVVVVVCRWSALVRI